MTVKPRLLITRIFPPAVMARAKKDFDIVVNHDDRPLGTAEILDMSKNVDAILCAATEAMSASLIDALPARVKIIATFSVGYDHVDIPAATAKGIVVTNTPDVLTDATADIALLCMLGAARLAHASAITLREGGWKRWAPNDFVGTHMSGKKLGILGMGRIGQAVARRARGFDMQIHYYNRRQVQAPGLEQAIYHDDRQSFLASSQFLSINCPLSEATHHFINEESIELLPRGAVLVNTARGPIVKDAALISALKSGRIAAAGLDVFENEPNLNPGYLDLGNLFVLPHIGSATLETRDQMGFMCLDNLDAFFGQKPLISPLNQTG